MSSEIQVSKEENLESRIVRRVLDYSDGEVPSVTEFDERDELPDYWKVFDEFGGLKSLSEATGLEYDLSFREFPLGDDWSHKEIVDGANQYSENGVLPSQKEFRNNESLPWPATVGRYFGSLEGLAFFTDLEMAGNSPKTLDRRTAEIREYFRKNEDIPSREEISGWTGFGEIGENEYERLLDEAGIPHGADVKSPSALLREGLTESEYWVREELGQSDSDFFEKACSQL